jgi:ribonucleoside-diphosphate reductase alpha chain
MAGGQASRPGTANATSGSGSATAKSTANGSHGATASATNGTAKRGPANGTAPNGTAKNGAATNGSSKHAHRSAVNAEQLQRAGVAMKVDLGVGLADRTEQFARFQTDAPSCDNCGAITVRNGNCYLCHNCGNSMGCS